MLDGSRGGDGIAVFIGQFGSAQTHDQIVNQPWKMSGSFLIAAMIDLLERLAEVDNDTPIRFREPLDNRITVGGLRSYYGSLFITWLR